MSKMDPLNAYKETSIRTASQGQLIVMIYEEAIRQITIAATALEEGTKRLDTVHNAIVKAQDLVTELTASLDFERGGEIARGLFDLYIFFRDQLSLANMKKSREILESVRAMLSELKEAWVQISKAGVDRKHSASTGLNIAG